MMIVLQTVSSLDKVFSHTGPTLIQNGGSMLRNERFNFQLSIYNDGCFVNGVSLKVQGLPESAVTVREVREIAGQCDYYPTCDDYYIFTDDKQRVFPELLQPFNADNFFLRGWQWTTLWITVYMPEGLPAGKHNVGFALTLSDGTTSTAEYLLDVIDARLKKSNLIYTNWMHYDSIAEYYNVEPFSDRFYALFGTFLDTAVLHGMNMLYTPLFTPPLDTAVGGERLTVQLVGVTLKKGVYSFEFSKLDRFIDFALSRGVAYFEFSHLTTQWGAKACPKIMADTDDGRKRIFGWDTPSLGAEYKAFLSAFLPALDMFLREKGVTEKCVFHISDEPSADQREDFGKVFDFIRPLIADYKIMDATSDLDNDMTDYPVISIQHAVKNMNPKNWVYYCCSAYSGYFSNRFFNMPSQRNRIIGMQLYLNDIKGFLQWGFNFYRSQLSLRRIDPFSETDGGGSFPSGDSFIVYPGFDGAWDSLRLEVFYDGLQDRMALKLLEEKVGRPEVVRLLKAEGLDGYGVYPRSAQWHTNFRNKINDLLR